MQFGELIATALANAQGERICRRSPRSRRPCGALRRWSLVANRRAPSSRSPSRRDTSSPPLGSRWSDGTTPMTYRARGRLEPRRRPQLVGPPRGARRSQRFDERVSKQPASAQRSHSRRLDTASALARKWARSSAGAPINVKGRLWGVLIVGAADEDALPAGTEHRLAQFTELVATAIGNAEAREELRRVADEQAALRRVATLVARDEAPEAAFAAVAEELGHLFRGRSDRGESVRSGGTVTTVGSWNSVGDPSAPESKTTLGGDNVTTRVFRREGRRGSTGRRGRLEWCNEHRAPSRRSVGRQRADSRR